MRVGNVQDERILQYFDNLSTHKTIVSSWKANRKAFRNYGAKHFLIGCNVSL